MNQILSCVSLSIGILMSVGIFASYEYRLRDVRASSYSYFPVPTAYFYDCWVIDKDTYNFDCKFLEATCRPFGDLDYRDVFHGLTGNVLRTTPSALCLRGYHDAEFFQKYGLAFIDFLSRRSTVKYLAFDGTCFDEDLLSECVIRACGSGEKPSGIESISFPVGDNLLPLASSFRERGGSHSSGVSSTSSCSCKAEADDDLPFAIACKAVADDVSSPCSCRSVSSATRRRSSAGSDALTKRDSPREGKQSLRLESVRGNKLCDIGGAVFLSLELGGLERDDSGGSHKICSMQLKIVFPQKTAGYAMYSEQDPTKLFNMAMVVLAGAHKEQPRYVAEYLQQQKGEVVPIVLDLFRKSIEVVCFLEGREASLFRVPIVAFDEKLCNKLLVFLGSIVPAELQRNHSLWDFGLRGAFKPIGDDAAGLEGYVYDSE